MTDRLFTSNEVATGGSSVEAHVYTGTLIAHALAPTGLALITSPKLQIIQDDTVARDIQIEVSTVSSFASTVWTSTQTAVAAHTPTIVTVGAVLTNGTTYWWRVRAVDTSGPTYGPWEVKSFTVHVLVGGAYESVLLNAGFVLTQSPYGAYEPVLLNAGFTLVPLLPVGAYEWVLLNAGVQVTLGDGGGYEYVLLGDVNTAQPLPYIWYIKPGSGRPGDGVKIVGMGFGDTQIMWGGIVQADLGAGWVTIGVVSWQTFPADPPMYGPSRAIDPSIDVVDPQHNEIEITIPSLAVPPGIPLRVVLNI